MTPEKALDSLIQEIESVARFCDELADPEHSGPDQAATAEAIGKILRIAIEHARVDAALIERDRFGMLLQ